LGRNFIVVKVEGGFSGKGFPLPITKHNRPK